jgi:hypothetical protein
MATVDHLPEITRRLCERLAQRLRDEPLARALWVSESPGRIEFWILTDEIDLDAELRLQAAGGVLYADCPPVDVLLHILNPIWYGGGDPALAIPEGAAEIPLRAA